MSGTTLRGYTPDDLACAASRGGEGGGGGGSLVWGVKTL